MLISSHRARTTALLAALALVASGGLTGCGSTGSDRVRVSPEARRARVTINDADLGRLGYRRDWVGYPVVASRRAITFFEPYEDIVVAQDGSSTVSVLEASNGAQRWANEMANPLTRFVGINRDDNNIRISSEAELFTLDAQTGSLQSRQSFEKIVATRPVHAGSVLIYGAGAGELFAHLAVGNIDALKAWGHSVSGAIDRDPVRIGDVVGAVSQRGEVIFVDIASGAMVGRNRIHGGIDAPPAADDSAMYIASLDQSIYAFDPDGGSEVWRHRTARPQRGRPVAHGGRLYITLDPDGLTSFDAASGRVLWTAPEVKGRVVAVNNGQLIVWDGQSAALVDPQRGDLIERARLEGFRTLKPDRFENGNLYAVSGSGVVVKLAPRLR